MTKQSWSSFATVTSQSFVPELVTNAIKISPDQLVMMTSHRRDERISACRGRDPIHVLLAYAQDELAYDEHDTLVTMAEKAYRELPREQRLNKFGHAYRRDARLWLHETLADIVVGAAIHLYNTQGWTTILYDGLRTVEGAFALYNFATDQDIASGLLALPGQSAHNKGMAVDSMMEDANGDEVPMGGHFDHLDMGTNMRTYSNLPATVRENRRIREAAFLYGALTQGLLVAPLRSEFWDDRLPENRADLWRVLDSAARCLGVTLLTPEDDRLRKEDRAAFAEKWEGWTYDDFLSQWQEIFKGREEELERVFGVNAPPPEERPEFYHGNYHPIYDRDLVDSGKNLIDLDAA